ncbi:MAG: hypothetical protein NTW84_00190 [Methanothrix sp.]|nr:hypothetical protein [Methanothrix sp.]
MEENDSEFLRALHEEKIRTQNERADFVTRKLAFITVLFGISTVNLGINVADVCWFLYFVPLVAISYDLYIMSADSRIKRIGIFLGKDPLSKAGKAEKEWEMFCTYSRDDLAPSANMFFSAIVTAAAAVFIRSQQTWLQGYARLWFALWLVLSLAVIVGLWMRHRLQMRYLGKYKPFMRETFAGR